MAGLLQGVGGLVGAGVKGLLDMAEGYLHNSDENDGDGTRVRQVERRLETPEPVCIALTTTSSPASSSAASAASAFSHLSITQPTVVELVDVPSGWIHLQSTYLDGTGGERKVRSFGLRNVGEKEVYVEVGSDLDQQIVFWKEDDERDLSSAASYSSSSSSRSNAGTTTLIATLPPLSTSTFFLTFIASHTATPPNLMSPTSEGGFTPRVAPTMSREWSEDIAPIPIVPGLSSASSASDSASVASSQSVVGSFKAKQPRRQQPVHRAFSVHGSITFRASTSSSPCSPPNLQHLNLPFFATVCKSLFTAALIDPISGLATGSQRSSGQMIIDFGFDSIVGQEYHRDILLVNRSEIELVWITAVVNARYKDATWFSLRDLDSENVFGVDTSSQPVPLPALSSRHLRLELRVKEPVPDFSFDFVISNVHESGNLVTCRAIGSVQPETTDTSLKILSGTTLDFGQITDGVWAKTLITCKNAGEKPLAVKFSASQGVDVVFRLAGVAGDDVDEDIPMEKLLPSGKKLAEQMVLSRTFIGERGRSAASLTSSAGRASSAYEARSTQFGPSADGSSVDGESHASSSNRGTSISTSNRDPSLPPSRPLSCVASHTSSYRHHGDATESDEEDLEPPFFSNGEALSVSPPAPQQDCRQATELITDLAIPNQIEELAMRPGTEYRIFVLFRPSRDTLSPPEIAGSLRPTRFKVYLDSTPSSRSSSSSSLPPTRHTLHSQAESCTSLISISSGLKIDFGEVTVGASKSAVLKIRNDSHLSAKIEIAAISKVLSTNRNIIVIPPEEEVEEKMEFFPRRINERYEKQVFVRNLLNRANDQLVEIRSKNVDFNNVTLHSHLYRILTPNGANFLNFGSVIINSPTVRTLLFENLTFAPLVLSLMASQTEDVELCVKLEDCHQPMERNNHAGVVNKYADNSALERVTSHQAGDLKERFMETLRDLGSRPASAIPKPKTKAKGKEKPVAQGNGSKAEPDGTGNGTAPKQSIGAAVAAALKKGGRGRPVQLYGNAVMFKERSLLDEHEHLDLAAGPPIAAHRTSPRSKKSALLDSIESEDKAKLSGQGIPKLDFAASAKATGLVSKDNKKRKAHLPLPSPKLPSLLENAGPRGMPNVASMISSAFGGASGPNTPEGGKSPALTGKRAEPKTEMFSAGDISKMAVDELLVAIEQHDARRSSAGSSWTLEEEEVFVRRTISLRKELSNLISSGRLIPAQHLSIPPKSSRQLIVIMTPNGTIRPHISTRPKRADSRLFIRLNEFDRSFLSAATPSVGDQDLPVRDLIMRSNCVRSVLEVQQTSINMGNCEKGEVKSKTIVIQNKSDSIGLFRLRTSGSIASGDLRLGLGRYGVISAFGRREVENFSFTPSLVGNYQENVVVENVLDSYQDQNVAVKANVRKQPNFTVDPPFIDFGRVDPKPKPHKVSEAEMRVFVLANTSKSERTFVIEVSLASVTERFAELSLARDETDAGTALSKEQEEEAEGLLQKLKIARRKGKPDKILKYQARLTELGVSFPRANTSAAASESDAESVGEVDGGSESAIPAAESDHDRHEVDIFSGVIPNWETGSHNQPQTCVSTLTITLPASQKTKISVQLLLSSRSKVAVGEKFEAKINVYEKKNTDETILVGIIALIGRGQDLLNAASREGEDGCFTTEPLHLALMRHCLELTLLCPVSPTAFCVGSTLFLPSTSTYHCALQPHFPPFSFETTTYAGPPTRSPGLILADGYSRQIPGNTHAEANALANFGARYTELPAEDVPAIDEVLKQVDCYATMEPCSIRTSGGPSCALELVRSKVRTVYLGVKEPPDFVQCRGVRILEEGGVQVRRTIGLEEDCLKAARRGRD